jgi:general secretion pathway protein I
MKNSTPAAAGFTLLEVMVAIAILAIGLTVLYSSQSQSLSVAAVSDFTATSAHLGSTQMAEILQNDASERFQSGTFGTPYEGYKWRVEFHDADNTAQLIPQSAVANLERIDLIITDTRRSEAFVMTRYRFMVP